MCTANQLLSIGNHIDNFKTLELPVSWEHIGGLDEIISQIQETVILPFQRHEYFKQCKLFMPPKGILVYNFVCRLHCDLVKHANCYNNIDKEY